MRVLAVDWGKKKTGLAVSDELGITVRPLTTLRNLPPAGLIQRIADIVAEDNIQCVVVGLPLAADGSTNDAAERVARFVERLRPALACPVETWNERLTSYAADEWMKERGYSREERDRRSDEVAAAILLEDYLADRLR